MTSRGGTKLLTGLLKHSRIGLGAWALMLFAASVFASGDTGTVLAKVAYAGEMARFGVVDTFHTIDAEFALSEPVYRGTDRGMAMLIVALVLSGILAFNIWFFWHLHRVYAALR
jgi:hypothetical protein